MAVINLGLTAQSTGLTPLYDPAYPDGDRPSGGTSGTISYSGTITGGSTITVTAVAATNFGTSGPTLAYFETMDNQAAETALSTTGHEGNATASAHGTGGAPIVVAYSDAPNGRGIKVGRKTTAQSSTAIMGLSYAKSDEIFEHQISVWPAANKAIAESAGLGSQGGAFNVKTCWNMYESGDAGSNSLLDYFMGVPQWLNPNFGGGEAFSGNTSEFNSDMGWGSSMSESSDYSTDPFVRQSYLKANPTAGVATGSVVAYKCVSGVRGELSDLTTSDTVRVRGSGHTPTDGVVSYSDYPGYVRGIGIDNGAFIIFSEQYIAVGPNCRARIELCDTITPLSTTKKIGIQRILTWSATEITFEVNESWWHSTGITGSYIHVYDATNTFIGSVEV